MAMLVDSGNMDVVWPWGLVLLRIMERLFITTNCQLTKGILVASMDMAAVCVMGMVLS